jgi:hypothetical protein
MAVTGMYSRANAPELASWVAEELTTTRPTGIWTEHPMNNPDGVCMLMSIAPVPTFRLNSNTHKGVVELYSVE